MLLSEHLQQGAGGTTERRETPHCHLSVGQMEPCPNMWRASVSHMLAGGRKGRLLGSIFTYARVDQMVVLHTGCWAPGHIIPINLMGNMN